MQALNSGGDHLAGFLNVIPGAEGDRHLIARPLPRLVRAYESLNDIVLVREDDVALSNFAIGYVSTPLPPRRILCVCVWGGYAGVEFDKQVVPRLSGAYRDVYHAINTQLSHVFDALGTKIPPQLRWGHNSEWH